MFQTVGMEYRKARKHKMTWDIQFAVTDILKKGIWWIMFRRLTLSCEHRKMRS